VGRIDACFCFLNIVFSIFILGSLKVLQLWKGKKIFLIEQLTFLNIVFLFLVFYLRKAQTIISNYERVGEFFIWPSNLFFPKYLFFVFYLRKAQTIINNCKRAGNIFSWTRDLIFLNIIFFYNYLKKAQTITKQLWNGGKYF